MQNRQFLNPNFGLVLANLVHFPTKFSRFQFGELQLQLGKKEIKITAVKYNDLSLYMQGWQYLHSQHQLYTYDKLRGICSKY